MLFNFISFLNNLNLYDIIIHCSSKSDPLDEIQNKNYKFIVYEKSIQGSNIAEKLLRRISYYFRYLCLLIKYRPSVVYSNTINNSGQICISKLLGCKIILHVHEGRAAIEKIKWKIKLSDIFVDQYIVVSKYVGTLMSEYTSSKIELIYNGIELIPLPARDKFDIVNIGVIGSIHPNKGQLIAVKAIEFLMVNFNMNVKLNIIGKVADKNYFQKLNDYIEKNSLAKRIQYRGSLASIKEIYENLDIVVVPSFDESFSLVKVEAMSLKRILIASNVGGIAENIENGENALLFDVGDYIGLAKRIKEVIDDKTIMKKITENAYNTVLNNYNINDTNNKILNVINRVIEEGKGNPAEGKKCVVHD